MEYTDKELEKMALEFANNNFNSFGIPRFHNVALADLLYRMLVKVKEGKNDNKPDNK